MEAQNEARSDLSERPTEVAPEVWSDLLERHTKVARVLSSGGTKLEHPGATPQSDLPRSLPARATSQSDQLKSLAFPWRVDPGATSSERHSQVAREETTRE